MMEGMHVPPVAPVLRRAAATGRRLAELDRVSTGA